MYVGDMKSALLHVSLAFTFCLILANTSLFNEVEVDLTYGHYAEKPVADMPAVLVMPANCVVNVAYVVLGLFWLLRPESAEEPERSRYMRHVFAFMALFYGPVQWTRLATLRRAPAVLDQWLTLPIFAWVPAWIDYIERAPPSRAAALELCSIASYGLALAHERGFELALGCHVALALYRGARLQLTHGDGRARVYLLLATLSCVGFVVLKLLDHWLARFWLFQRLTGHFWSKVCDVLQFHFCFCFLTRITHRTRVKVPAKQQ